MTDRMHLQQLTRKTTR